MKKRKAEDSGASEKPAPLLRPPENGRKKRKAPTAQLRASGRQKPQPPSLHGAANGSVPSKDSGRHVSRAATEPPAWVPPAPSAGGLSSNWLQLQKVLQKPGGTRSKRAREKELPEDTTKKQKTSREGAEVATKGAPKVVGDATAATRPLGNNKSVTQVLAMDCEMVGVGHSSSRSVLARVCLVNSHGHVVYDKYVRPIEEVTDYRTHVSGVRARDLSHARAEDFWEVQKEVAALLKGRILVGHALHNDLKGRGRPFC